MIADGHRPRLSRKEWSAMQPNFIQVLLALLGLFI